MAEHEDDEITVQITDLHPRDADAVVAVLQDHFQVTIPTPVAGSAAGPARGARVWCFRLDATAGGPDPAEPVVLTRPVDVELIGAADSVRRVRDLLTSAFGAENHGTVPGEHEVELRLRLGPAARAA